MKLSFNLTPVPKFVYGSLIAAAVLSAYSIWKRFQVESENRAVAIAAEYETVEALAGARSLDIHSGLQDLKAQGLNALVLSEETIGELLAQGKATLISVPGSGPNGAVLQLQDPAEAPRIQRALRMRFGNLAGSLDMRANAMALPPVSTQLIRTTAIGLNPNEAAVAKKEDLIIIARCENPGGANAATVSGTLAWAHEMGATIFLPEGDEVLGRRDAMDTAVDSFRTLPLLYASAEFAKIAGDTEILEQAPELVVRLHSAQTGELDKLTPEQAVDRYVKAARERDMRVLLVRPISFSSSDQAGPLGRFDDFVKKITDELLKRGQVIGDPHPYHEPGLPKAFFVLLGLAIAPTVWYSVARFVKTDWIRIAGAVGILLLGLACFTKHGPPLMALLASMACPVVAFLALDDWASKGWPADGEPAKAASIPKVLTGFWLVSGIALVGGLVVAGLLNSLPYYVKAVEFPAIRVSVFFPIFAIGAYYFVTLNDWRSALKSPITWGASLLALTIGAALALMLARTGNDSGVGPSDGEVIFRNLLDRFLYVRPRTKEFLVGHPFLCIGVGALLAGKTRKDANALKGWTVLALMLGAIGQTSVVNTLCHIHMPVLLSLARDFEGLLLGCIIGSGIWMLVKRPILGTEAN